jgi:hypothetical protein
MNEERGMRIGAPGGGWLELLEQRLLLSGNYDLKVIAKTGDVLSTGETITAIESPFANPGFASINHDGNIAFLANLNAGGQAGSNVLLGNATTGVRRIGLPTTPSRSYQFTSINDSTLVVAVDTEALLTPIDLTGTGAGWKIRNFPDGSYQRVDYTADVSATFELGQPTASGQDLLYPIHRASGSVHFYGSAFDSLFNETLNFDDTENFEVIDGGGQLRYSYSTLRVESVLTPLPLGSGNPDVYGIKYQANPANGAEVGTITLNVWFDSSWYFTPAFDLPGSITDDDVMRVRKWNGSSAGSFNTVASTRIDGPNGPYALLGQTTLANDGKTAFIGLPASGGRNLYSSSGGPGTETNAASVLAAGTRPMAGDGGTIVWRDTVTGGSAIKLRQASGATLTLASSANGWTNLGNAPGISDDGQIIIFAGTSPTAGDGVFVVTNSSGVISTPVKIAGISGDGILDRNERWNDFNHNGVVNAGEDSGQFSSFSSGTHVNVNGRNGKYFAALLANDASSALGLYTIAIATTSSGVADVGSADLVIRAGTVIAGQTISTLRITDSLNDNNDLAILATSTSGQEMLIFGAHPIVVPACHSLPTASKKLFLDFSGNAAFTFVNPTPFTAHGNGSNTTPISAFTLDSDSRSFTAAELDAIHQIWMIIAEKYSPFNIDVTTEDPGNRTHGLTEQVIFGGSDNDWYGRAAGGLSAIGGFSDLALSNNCFVWTGDSNWSTPANVVSSIYFSAVTAAHEAGHAFGLNHEKSPTSSDPEYYDGDLNRVPIMGNAGNKGSKRAIWWQTNMEVLQNTAQPFQDELAVISGTIGYRADVATATALSVSGTTYSGTGIIEQISDSDYFSLTTSAGTLGFQVNVAPLGAMLDAVLELRNSAGTLLYQADTSSLGESLPSMNVVAGTYYVVVRSKGNYGDVGQYTVSGTFTAPKVRVQVGSTQISNGATTPVAFGSIVLGQIQELTFSVYNDGNGLLSLGSLSVPSGYTVTNPLSSSISPGQSDTFTLRLDPPTVGIKSGNVSFSTNDSDENPFVFAISGVVTLPNWIVASPSATFSLTGAVGNQVLHLASGSITLPVDAGGAVPALSIVQSDGSITMDSSQHLASLQIESGSATLSAGGSRWLFSDSISVGSGGQLDLNDNDLVVNNGSFSMLQSLVFAGYSDGPDSTRTGIVSSKGQRAGGSTILALFDNSLAGFADWPPESGNTISPNAIVGHYTLLGDTNMDGQVTRQDYTAIDSNLGTSVDPRISWFYGDTNFDGEITAQDYTAIDSALGMTLGQLPNAFAAQGSIAKKDRPAQLLI